MLGGEYPAIYTPGTLVAILPPGYIPLCTSLGTLPNLRWCAALPLPDGECWLTALAQSVTELSVSGLLIYRS